VGNVSQQNKTDQFLGRGRTPASLGQGVESEVAPRSHALHAALLAAVGISVIGFWTNATFTMMTPS